MTGILFQIVKWLGANIAGFGVGWATKDVIEGKGVPKEKANLYLIVLGLGIAGVVFFLSKNFKIK